MPTKQKSHKAIPVASAAGAGVVVERDRITKAVLQYKHQFLYVCCDIAYNKEAELAVDTALGIWQKQQDPVDAHVPEG